MRYVTLTTTAHKEFQKQPIHYNLTSARKNIYPTNKDDLQVGLFGVKITYVTETCDSASRKPERNKLTININFHLNNLTNYIFWNSTHDKHLAIVIQM